MSKQEPKDKTFDVLRFVADNAGLSIFDAIEKAYNMGLCEQELCDDAISRDELLKAIDTWDKFGCDANTKLVPYQDHYIPYIHYDDVIECIKNMPSVIPQSKTGQWMRKTKVDKAYDIAGVETWGIECQCDRCGFTTTVIEDFGYYKYCPNCGAKMLSTDSNCDSCKYQNEVDGSNCYECVKGIRDNYTKENVSRIKVESGD